nr:MAG TPA: hypothetical protein [Caudoviricetes sp.]
MPAWSRPPRASSGRYPPKVLCANLISGRASPAGRRAWLR